MANANYRNVAFTIEEFQELEELRAELGFKSVRQLLSAMKEEKMMKMAARAPAKGVGKANANSKAGYKLKKKGDEDSGIHPNYSIIHNPSTYGRGVTTEDLAKLATPYDTVNAAIAWKDALGVAYN
jgi:hypothetical protein